MKAFRSPIATPATTGIANQIAAQPAVQTATQIAGRITRRIAGLVLGTLLLTALYAEETNASAFASAESKIAWVQENGHSPNPSNRPTVLTAEEWNAYLNQGGVKLPEGLSNLRVSCQSSEARGEADVDFDRLTANRTRANPLLAIFTGMHHVTVRAQAAAVSGVGTVHVESVMLDGVTVPRLALEYFASRYLRPKYGNAVGLDSTFPIHSRIDTVVLGADRVTITQR